MTNAIPRIVLLSGNTHRPSKSRSLAGFLGERLAEKLDVSIVQYDLIDLGPALGAAYFRSQLDDNGKAILEDIESADALIVTSPVYKGSYPGLFKHLIDLLDIDALVDTPVLIGATGGGHRHALMVEHQLRPLFGFFTALINPTTVYVSDNEFTDTVPTHPPILDRIDVAIKQFARIIEAQQADHLAEDEDHLALFDLVAAKA